VTQPPAEESTTAADLDDLFFRLFRLRGVLDPTGAVPGLGASVSEIMTLTRLSESPANQQTLVGFLGLEKSTVSRLIDSMIRKGWVEKERDESNRRYQLVRLTAAGRRAARETGNAMHRRHVSMAKSLSEQERTVMVKGVRILVSALERSVEQSATDQPE
jgi:DNA-binding MarR family transcriptional regulator